MTTSPTLRTTLFRAFLFGAFLSTSWADAGNKKTYVTFRQPVEVPGAVLPPGKYVMKLLDSPSNRHVVQIAGEDEKRVYCTILAVPDYRPRPVNRTVLTFYEMPAGQPQALRAWFYPGDSHGQGFTYPRRRAIEIAQASRQQVAVASVERPPVPLVPAVPAKREPRAETALATVAETAAEPGAAETAAEAEPAMPAEDLPGTGRPTMLLVGLAGAGALATAAVLRLLVKKLA
jgi:hypothetical protein